MRDQGALDAVQLIRPQTQALGHRQWAFFFAWLDRVLGADAKESLWLCPGLMGHMLASYGRHLFDCGKALFNFRHLVVFAQREYPGLRGHLQRAWDTIARWEELEPVEHRRPIPVALLWGWSRVACVLVISFFGCCRPGEVLKACRGQVVLPEDLGQMEGPVFFRIQKPKPGRRGLGRVQYTKIVDKLACQFLSQLLGQLPSELLIFPGSASSFRTRWNKLLVALKVPSIAEITPAASGRGVQLSFIAMGRL